MLTVACVLSDPIRPGHRNYDRSHVERLREQVAEHLTPPYTFICLDDSPFRGWWAKISLFETGRFEGRVLYLDLDVSITDSLDDIAYYPEPFVICGDWQYPLRFNSSVMSWDANGIASKIYDDFYWDVQEEYRGDQEWIFHCLPRAATFPRKWVRSYKADLKRGKNMLGSRVIVYHGSPKPWEVDD